MMENELNIGRRLPNWLFKLLTQEETRLRNSVKCLLTAYVEGLMLLGTSPFGQKV